MAQLCVLWILPRDVFPRSLHTNVCHRCHSAKEDLGSRSDDTVPHPGGYTQGPSSNNQWNKCLVVLLFFFCIASYLHEKPKTTHFIVETFITTIYVKKKLAHESLEKANSYLIAE